VGRSNSDGQMFTTRTALGSACGVERGRPVGGMRRDDHLHYFNARWERMKVFGSAEHAHAVARVLLCRRDPDELPLLDFVVNKAVTEYPNSGELQGLRVSLMRFVFCRNSEAAAEEKKLRGGRGEFRMRLDLRYVLYAVERKGAQDYAAATLGKVSFSSTAHWQRACFLT
jgi:hypothetical protein